ncbi:hypothetical protein M378DRAFT_673368 [Amanita muscaria Koide BX008]|uniref:Uncharacterized protein n=1 Tax=Amanita muscaria (strain Koide BX008) TaxID=946122 RepID=A0A0C2WFJ7_AMAMK|nr:hypothetical protein M378DRAFT_673368 [Amanita muscaria Koide BX008]
METQLLYLPSKARFKGIKALAVDKVTKAGRARDQAQRAQNRSALQSHPPPALSAQLSAIYRASGRVSLAVRGIVKRLSATHLASNRAPAVHATLSHDSTSSLSSSDMASLLDDAGSSSSSGWTSNDSCSEDENGNDGILHANPAEEDAADTTIIMANPRYCLCRKQLSVPSTRSSFAPFPQQAHIRTFIAEDGKLLIHLRSAQ